VNHHIEPVTNGVRLTITYDLRRPKAGRGPRRLGDEEALAAVHMSKLAEHWPQPTSSLAFKCSHLYNNKQVNDALGDESAPWPIDGCRLELLKGRDRQIASAALAAGFDVRLVPFVWGGDHLRLDYAAARRFPDGYYGEGESEYFGKTLGLSQFLVEDEEGEDNAGHDDKEEEEQADRREDLKLWNVRDLDRSDRSTRWVLDDGPEEEVEWMLSSDYGHAGNEGITDYFYLKTALLIRPKCSAAKLKTTSKETGER